jgi:small-conductance mechanosensitive channel
MKRTPQLTFAVILIALALILTAWVLTTPGTLSFLGNSQTAQVKEAKAQGIPPEFAVDKQPLVAARDLAAWAGTPEEQDLATEAEKTADHEVDLDFASALRRVNAHPPAPSKEARELEARVQQMEVQIKKDQDRALDLKQKADKAGSDEDNIQGQSELADAQLALDEDEIADAKGDLERAGGDVQSKVVHSREQHEAAEDARGKTAYGGAIAKASASPNSLRARIQEWNQARSAQAQIRAAQQQAADAAINLSHQHDALEKRVQEEQVKKQSLTQQASNTGTNSSTASAAKDASAAALVSVAQLSEDQRGMAELDKRIQDHQELATIYGRWLDIVKLQQWAALHAILQSLLWITAIVLLVYILSRIIERTLSDSTIADRKHLLTLRTVIRFSLKAAGLLAIVFVIFGVPDQMPTVLGLAGAGLTVALQDFIIGFCGWFVLMGRNGIRVGDFVEINGVGGEVVEIGLLRTVVLETGSATGSNYPTGRQVAFINSYAIKGHYFNFSTSGQWLWDELVVQVPAGEDSTPVVESILKIVTEDTEKNARMAEQEWQRVTQHYGVKAFSAAPSISVRPSGVSVEVVVRYITRAQERYEVRTRLYQAIVELFQGKKSITAAAQATLPSKAQG